MQAIFAKGNKRTIEKLRFNLKEARKDKAIHVATRIQGIILSLEGYTTGEIAHILDMNRTTIPLWINRWNQYKEHGLYEGYRSGRKVKLSPGEKEQLFDIVESGPVAYGLHTGVWTCPIIAQIIRQEFDVEYHVGHVWKILKEIGVSLQRPGYELINGKPSKKRRWIRLQYPNLKKKPLKKGR